MNDQSEFWAGPLAGIRVLDLTRVLSGPAASLALGDLGAEVIKVEPPGGGDDTRSFPPHRDGESHYFLSVNRNKKSIMIDLKTERGVEILKSLCAECDILVENFRPGVMDKLGLGYSTLSEVNPRLIYCAISGFGMSGPLHAEPSFDIVLQALSGAMSVNGEAGSDGTKMGIPLGDWVGGINGPVAILGALYEREKTGRGRLIDISLLDGMVNMLGYLAQLAFFTGVNPEPLGTEHPNLVPYGTFSVKDGKVVVACLTNDFWGRLCRALGMPEFIDDARYCDLERRRAARDEVNALVNARTSKFTMAELIELLTQHKVPNAPILGVLEALQSPQVQARGMVVEVEHTALGTIPLVNSPLKFVGVEQKPPSAPPMLGEHSDEILRSILKMSAEEIAALKSEQVIR